MKKHLFWFRYLIIPTMLLLFLSCIANKNATGGQVTMVILDATIWTGDAAAPKAEALAVCGDKIVAVGTTKQIKKLITDSTTVIDGFGKFVTPGFIDSHLHFLTGGFQLASVQLRDAQTPAEFIQRIKKYAEAVEPGSWITGGNWNHKLWGGDMPCHDWIDSVTTNNPVWINRLDGHMALANSLAMKIARITKDIKDIDGGTIVRDAAGFPTGIFKDNAMYLIDRAVPEPSDEMKDRAIQAAMSYVAEHGVTSIQHMGGWDDLVVFERAHKNGKLKTRLSAAVPLSTWKELKAKVAKEGNGDVWLRFGGLKGYADGSLGSHTAAFFQPFTDAPKDSGLLVNSFEDLYSWTKNADQAGLQVIVHAIGDRANHLMLNIFESVSKENGERDRRFRIEHAQHLAANDIPRFGQLHVIASMQPYHAIDDGCWAENVIGAERIRTTYAFRSLLDSGAKLALGSDWYVAPPIPLQGIYAAVTRRTLDGKNPNGWVPDQKITVTEALRAYTTDAAFASFEENVKGALKPGLLADFVMMDRDITAIPPEEIWNVQILMTVVGGKVIYKKIGPILCRPAKQFISKVEIEN